MNLNAYLQRTQLLLEDQTTTKFNLFDLTTYVNIARGQVCGEGECIRQYCILLVDDTAQQYSFPSIILPNEAIGVSGIINVRMVTYSIASGRLRVTPREWEWFNNYVLSQAAPLSGPPKYWSQFGQGNGGNLFVNLLDFTYTLNLDTVCFPADLTTNADVDAIPQYWQDAVPYYAAYLAMLPLVGAEQKAEKMLQLYELFVKRARQFATPSVLPHQYAQSTDVTLAAKLGLRPAPSARGDEAA